MLTVNQLIEKLSLFDGDTPVCFEIDYGSGWDIATCFNLEIQLSADTGYVLCKGTHLE